MERKLSLENGLTINVKSIEELKELVTRLSNYSNVLYSEALDVRKVYEAYVENRIKRINFIVYVIKHDDDNVIVKCGNALSFKDTSSLLRIEDLDL